MTPGTPVACLFCGHDLTEAGPQDALHAARTPEEKQRYGYCATCDLFVLCQIVGAEAGKRL